MLEIKADGLMAPGASGGPVVNNAGELIGVLSAAGAKRGELLCVEVGEVRRFLGRVHRAQATQAIRAGDYALAVAHCDRALAVYPDDPLSYNERGAAESFLDRLDDAIADYTQALKLDPKLAVAYRNRGSAYLHQDKWAEAVADCTRALKLDPEYVSAFQVRAKAYRKLGKVEEARADENAAASLEKKAK
jgi:tetratricopeptide (TPR) repeat protein